MDQYSPVSQRDVAEKLGMSQATVSMALAGHPRIPQATRERVLREADRLGYRPDPALRTLARYRRGIRPVAHQSNIAVATRVQSARKLDEASVYGTVFRSAASRADRLGYTLENFNFSPQMSSRRMTEILHSRGIQGVMLMPGEDDYRPIELDWREFCTVCLLDYSRCQPELHTVASDHFSSASYALEKLRLRGYERPGLVTTRLFEKRIACNYSAAFHTVLPPLDSSLSILWLDDGSREAFLRWYSEYEPDVVLVPYIVQLFSRVWSWIEGLEDGPDFFMLCLPDRAFWRVDWPDFSGMDECFELIAEQAVDFLVQRLEHFEIGLPAVPIRQLLRSRWHEGETLRLHPARL